MAMPLAAERVWTANDVRALPDDPHNRYECVDGVLLVSPAPRRSHLVMVMELVAALRSYLRVDGAGFALSAPSDVELDTRSLVQPDVYVLPLVDGRPPRDTDPELTPLLVIEVLSPSTARHDRLVKRPRYQRAGIECWLVDMDSRMVERWTPESARPEILVDTMTWQAPGALAEFRLDVGELFDEVLGPI